MRLTWSAFALADRDAVFMHIEADSPRAAIAVDEHIARRCFAWSSFPKAADPGGCLARANWSFPERPMLRLMPWPQIAFASCVCSTEPRCGRMTFLPTSCRDTTT